jgi:signal transduction histidine kinase
VIPSGLRTLLAEPRVPDPPRRVWRDWVVSGLTVTGGVLETVLRDDVVWRPVALIVCLAVAWLLLFRRTHPLAVTAAGFGLVMGVSVLAAFAGRTPFGLYTSAAMLLSAYAVGRWASGRDVAIGFVILIAAWAVGISTDPGTLGEAIGGLIVVLFPLAIGQSMRYGALARRRQLDQARLLEREQLARELHDTVAHHVSAIVIQAQAGRAVAATRPEAAADVLGVIEDVATRTLAEMRSLVGSLRGSEPAALAPLAGIADLPRLAAGVPGLAVQVELDGDLTDLRPSVDAAVFRIAQESITNAARHARHASRVDVRVCGDGDRVRLIVSDDGVDADREHAGTGFGLLGMAERVSVLGGTLRAGPSNGSRGWTVTAELPRHGVPA